MIFFWCFADFVVSWIPCCFGSFFFVCAAAKTAVLFPFYGQIPYRTDTSYTSYISPHEISGLSWLMHLYNLWWYFNEIKHYKTLETTNNTEHTQVRTWQITNIQHFKRLLVLFSWRRCLYGRVVVRIWVSHRECWGWWVCHVRVIGFIASSILYIGRT